MVKKLKIKKKAVTTEVIGTSCPLPMAAYPKVLLAHGSGGKLMHQLIEKVFRPNFKNSFLDQEHDGAVLEIGKEKLAVTTDSYVVHPLFFPGGDIGSLAIYGTVNDLAMCGARPLYLSAAVILEEGLPMETLNRITQSMAKAAKQTGIQLVTGDTKVVDQGKGDGIFINTTGIGRIEHDLKISPSQVKPGDLILVNGDIGRHGMAIMAVREGLSFESQIVSDAAPLSDLVLKLLKAGIEIHCMRDLTRGGLATSLNEIAKTGKVSIQIDERTVPVREDVHGACEILGFDPLYVANEGRFVLFISAQEKKRALKMMKAHPVGRGTCVIGEVAREPRGQVTLTTAIGTHRILDMLSGDQLPRIC